MSFGCNQREGEEKVSTKNIQENDNNIRNNMTME